MDDMDDRSSVSKNKFCPQLGQSFDFWLLVLLSPSPLHYLSYCDMHRFDISEGLELGSKGLE